MRRKITHWKLFEKAAICLAGSWLAVIPAPATAQNTPWRLTSFGGGHCLAKLYENGTRTSLEVERRSDGRIDLLLAGLRTKNVNEDPSGLLALYPATVTVSLNGAVRHTAETVKTDGWLEIKNIAVDRLRDLSPAGQLIFDVKGQRGQHETITFASTGLAPAIDFVTKCAGG